MLIRSLFAAAFSAAALGVFWFLLLECLFRCCLWLFVGKLEIELEKKVGWGF